MRLFMKKATDSAGLLFTLSDDRGKECYRVTCYKGTTCEKFSISTPEGISLARMRLVPLKVFYAFGFNVNGKTAALTISGIGVNPEYKFHGLDWLMKEDCFGKAFRIYDKQDKLVMSQRANRLNSQGYYELDIKDEEKELFCIAAAVCMNMLCGISDALPASI